MTAATPLWTTFQKLTDTAQVVWYDMIPFASCSMKYNIVEYNSQHGYQIIINTMVGTN